MNALSQNTQGQLRIERECPDYDCGRQICLTATGHIVPGRRQQMRCCVACDYDRCPIYPGQALRSNRTQCLVRDSIVGSGK